MTSIRHSSRETSENNSFYDQNHLESYKLPTGLLDMGILETNDFEPAQMNVPRTQRFNREDITRRRPRLTYSRWNMMISSRYKTELCRQFDEEGICQFEDKCLFAHGRNEIRPLPRHPKYKTELCRDFHETGFCSFGPRCNFIHTSEVQNNNNNNNTTTTRNFGSISKPSSTSAFPSPNDSSSSLSSSLSKIVKSSSLSNLNAEAPEWRCPSPPFEGILGEYVTNGQFGAIGENSNDSSKASSADDGEINDSSNDSNGFPAFQAFNFF